MCGIVVWYGAESSPEECREKVETSLARTWYRGPDHRGVASLRLPEGALALGMNRLSILDTSSGGQQPMELGDLVLVYNGEVYNYLELQAELRDLGHDFRGGSDTEVVLHAFQEWGEDCLTRFNGMFALALFDRARGELTLAVDRMGEKPLYLCELGDGSLAVSSELEGLRPHPEIPRQLAGENLLDYLVLGVVSRPRTLLASCQQLEPGEVRRYSLSGAGRAEGCRRRLYWELPERRPREDLREEEVLDELHALLEDAVRLRLRSDVPLGIFLSGGVDSSLLAALTRKHAPGLESFSIGYRDPVHDEGPYAARVAGELGLRHHARTLLTEDLELDFGELTSLSDDGTCNPSLLPLSHLARYTREHVVVALSGDGGDELFAGYTNYRRILRLHPLRHLLAAMAPLGALSHRVRAMSAVFAGDPDPQTAASLFRVKRSLAEVASLVRPRPPERLRQRVMVDRRTSEAGSFPGLNYRDGAGNYLNDIVLKTTDRATMRASLEARPVFTDWRLVEFSATLPDSLQVRGGVDKYLLRKLLARHLGEEYAFSRPKKGFSVPLTSDFRKAWRGELRRSEELYRQRAPDFLDVPAVLRILREDRPYVADFQSRFVFLAHFLERWGITAAREAP